MFTSLAAEIVTIMPQLAADPYFDAAQEDRGAPRTRVLIPAQLRPSGARGFRTELHDLSLSGFSAAAVNRLHDGQLVWLTIPGLESQQAKTVWWEAHMVGCAFENLLSPIVLENILARHREGSLVRAC